MITFALGLFLLTFLSKIDGSLQACDENEFTCNDGSCIDNFLVCDGVKHCPDGSDETSAVCSKVEMRCPSYAFRCAYGACIDESMKCDGNQNCADGSDEAPSECASSNGNVNSTVPNRVCPLGKFACDSKQCISDLLVCDGEENCRDGSDETQAKCINFPCPEIVGYQCAYGGCIDRERKCDNNKDCKDGSDEDPSACGGLTQTANGTSLSQEVLKCVRKLWPTLLKSLSQSQINHSEYATHSNSLDHHAHLLEQCFANAKPVMKTEESEDDIYGKYVSVRMKNFSEEEKIEIKYRIDKMFYFLNRNKKKGMQIGRNMIRRRISSHPK